MKITLIFLQNGRASGPTLKKRLKATQKLRGLCSCLIFYVVTLARDAKQEV